MLGCMNTPLDSSPVLQTAFAFWNSKVLLTAVEMGLFTKLSARPLTGAELGRELGLHPRGIKDFFDALVAMKFLGRDGGGPEARYFNTPEGAMYLDEMPTNLPEAIARMQDTVSRSPSGTQPLYVIADRTFSAQRFLNIIEAVRVAGIPVRIVTLDAQSGG